MKRGFEDEDMKQQALAYMTCKNFMAKRIFEQQAEIESLKDQLMTLNIKHTQLFDAYKLLGSTIAKDQFNLSGCELVNSLEIDDNKDNGILTSGVEFNPESLFDTGKQCVDKVLQQLKAENLELTKELEAVRADNIIKDMSITKLTSDRVLLYNELSELVLSLKKVNLEVLNKLYSDQTAKSKTVTSCLGVKINILSAMSQLAMISMNSGADVDVNSCMHVIKKFEDELSKII
jgi:hypothetical protein